MSECADESADSVSAIRELQAQLERFRQLYHVTNVIHSTLDPQEALQLILSEAARGLPPDASGVKLRVGEGITGHVALTKPVANHINSHVFKVLTWS